MIRTFASLTILVQLLLASPRQSPAQSVCLPVPRLLTMMPMGAARGTSIEVTITGEHTDGIEQLLFSHPGIKAVPCLDEDGRTVPQQFTVTVQDDCPTGIHEARLLTRLGISSSRVFNVGTLSEVRVSESNTTLESAMELTVGCIVNGATTSRAMDHFAFVATKGQRIVVDCAAAGIDSKLKAVLALADAQGNDLVVERRGGMIDFMIPDDGRYVIRIHDLTFKGGPQYFYRLSLQSPEPNELFARLPTTRRICEMSWPPHGLGDAQPVAESEPNEGTRAAQKISLPCDIAGTFYPAADVDCFEFEAKTGETWWIEVASERLGRSTDPSLVVQQKLQENGQITWKDVIEMSDIPSPVKVSSNGYSYDGPPYNVGSSDINGKLEIPADGTYRIRLTDLFGGTRNDPANAYRLIVRKAQPDFALAGWALHMLLRNGDRNALSKPIALRGGSTIGFEVIAIRRDGFNEAIDLHLENLPDGVTATGLRIPAGQSRGLILITAAEDAPRGMTVARFSGESVIDGQQVRRPGQFASMAWPVPDAWSEIPSPRLLQQIAVSVCGSERAPITIATDSERIWEVTAGGKLTVPLNLLCRTEFSSPKVTLKTAGPGFESTPGFEVALENKQTEAVLDLAQIKAPPGDYTIAFFGTAVAKYRYHPESIDLARFQLGEARMAAEKTASKVEQLTSEVNQAAEPKKSELKQRLDSAVVERKTADQTVAEAEKTLKEAESRAAPRDIADIVFSSPIRIRVTAQQEQESP